MIQKSCIPIKEGVPYSFEMSPDDLIQFVGLDPIQGKKFINQIITNDSIIKVENNILMSTDIYSLRNSGAIAGHQKIVPLSIKINKNCK